MLLHIAQGCRDGAGRGHEMRLSDRLVGRSPAAAKVPCNGCTACCRRELVPLLPEHGDDPGTFEVQEVAINGRQVPFLALRENGDCVYLGPDGCTIHARAPAVCRAFDCRRFFLSMTRAERRQMDHRSEIFAAARARLATLTEAERQAAIRGRRA